MSQQGRLAVALATIAAAIGLAFAPIGRDTQAPFLLLGTVLGYVFGKSSGEERDTAAAAASTMEHADAVRKMMARYGPDFRHDDDATARRAALDLRDDAPTREL